jgi:hypothetical protein
MNLRNTILLIIVVGGSTYLNSTKFERLGFIIACENIRLRKKINKIDYHG